MLTRILSPFLFNNISNKELALRNHYPYIPISAWLIPIYINTYRDSLHGLSWALKLLWCSHCYSESHPSFPEIDPFPGHVCKTQRLGTVETPQRPQVVWDNILPALGPHLIPQTSGVQGHVLAYLVLQVLLWDLGANGDWQGWVLLYFFSNCLRND